MNHHRLELLADYLEDMDPKRFLMRNAFTGPDGWAVPFSKATRPRLRLGIPGITLWLFADHTCTDQNMYSDAMSLLGLKWPMGDRLFRPPGYHLDPPRSPYTAIWASRVVRYLIETGAVSWGIVGRLKGID